MRLKRELKHCCYGIFAFVLFSVTCAAYVVVLWALPLILLFLAFTKIVAVLGTFTGSILIMIIGALLMWFSKHNMGFISQVTSQITHLLNTPGRYGCRLLDRINQETRK